MSLNSGLTRDKHGALMRDGKHVTLSCDTGDDTPVIQDERFDVDLNKLVSNEMARQDLLRVPGPGDYPDLTDRPESRGAAEHRALTIRQNLEQTLLPGETYENALRRHMAIEAQVQASIRELNAKRADSEPQKPPKTPATPSETPDPSTSKAKP